MKSIFIFLAIVFIQSNIKIEDKIIPIYFREYGIEIRTITQLGDTIYNRKNSKEHFKFVFYDIKGKCYCERFINGKLYEKGNFANSLDTLKSYKSGIDLEGKFSPITVYKYFEPLKDGNWIVYEKGKEKKVKYIMGTLVKNDL